VCGELAKHKKKTGGIRRASKSGAMTLAGLLAAGTSLFAHFSYAEEIDPSTLPQGAQIVHGGVEISTNNNAMNVVQSTDKAIVNWNSFNVGSQASVNFDQPSSSSSILNRVKSLDASKIFGQITSNGQVLLINPNGVLFSETARVDVGGLIASTLDIANEDYLSGNYNFSGNTGEIINRGELSGGLIALLSPSVINEGKIAARVDNVVLAGTETARLTFAGSELIAIEVDPAKLESAIKNSGSITAENGTVILKADAAQELLDDLINTPEESADELVFVDGVPQLISSSGSIKAEKVEVSAGSGAVTVSGDIDVSSESDKGGTIEITADAIKLESTAKLDATGAKGGGDILVGGDWQGSGDLQQATKVTVESGAVLDASATERGDGGKVVVWSDVSDSESMTRVNGSLFAKGGPLAGGGGQIETSGRIIDVVGAAVSTIAFDGSAGEWLIDPYNFFLGETELESLASALNSNNITLNSTNSSQSSFLAEAAVYPDSKPLYSSGHIVFQNDFTYSGANARTLSLIAAESGDIYLEGLSSTNAALSLDLTATGDNVYLNGNVTTFGGSITLSANSINFQSTGNQLLSSGNGDIDFGDANLTLLNSGGEVSILSGTGSISFGSGAILNTNTKHTITTPSQKLERTGVKAQAEAFTDIDTGVDIVAGNEYSMRLWFWDSWDNEYGQIKVGTTSYFSAYRTYNSGFSSINPRSGVTYFVGDDGTSRNYSQNTGWNDGYIDVTFVAAESGNLYIREDLDSNSDDESFELSYVYETGLSLETVSSTRDLKFESQSAFSLSQNSTIAGSLSLTAASIDLDADLTVSVNNTLVATAGNIDTSGYTISKTSGSDATLT